MWYVLLIIVVVVVICVLRLRRKVETNKATYTFTTFDGDKCIAGQCYNRSYVLYRIRVEAHAYNQEFYDRTEYLQILKMIIPHSEIIKKC